MDKINFLPQTFYKFKLEEYKKDSILKKLKYLNWTKNEGNYASEIDLKNEDSFIDLISFFNNCLEQVKNDLNLECEYLKVVSCWANKTEKNGYHHWHNHKNSWASGILYLTESNSSTLFWMKSQWSDVGESKITICGENSPQINGEYKTTVGDLLIFPSNIFHQVSTHLLPTPRYTISFNSFPCGNIGTFDKLSHINLSLA